jgi:hypothetical protein
MQPDAIYIAMYKRCAVGEMTNNVFTNVLTSNFYYYFLNKQYVTRLQSLSSSMRYVTAYIGFGDVRNCHFCCLISQFK